MSRSIARGWRVSGGLTLIQSTKICRIRVGRVLLQLAEWLLWGILGGVWWVMYPRRSVCGAALRRALCFLAAMHLLVVGLLAQTTSQEIHRFVW